MFDCYVLHTYNHIVLCLQPGYCTFLAVFFNVLLSENRWLLISHSHKVLPVKPNVFFTMFSRWQKRNWKKRGLQLTLRPAREKTWKERLSTVWMMTTRQRCRRTIPSKVRKLIEIRLLNVLKYLTYLINKKNTSFFVHRFPLRKWYRSLLQSWSRPDEIHARWEVLCCSRLHQTEPGIVLFYASVMWKYILST